MINGRRQPSCDDTSRMMRECHYSANRNRASPAPCQLPPTANFLFEQFCCYFETEHLTTLLSARALLGILDDHS
jgi:hypothetical protein